MRRLIAALLLLLCVAGAALGELSFTWEEGEAFFPEDQAWTYRYRYRYPVAQGEDALAEGINYYFEQAHSEMMALVIPMYADDPIMGEGQQNTICDVYELTRNDEQIISFLQVHEQTVGGENLLSLRSAVFAASGEYAGETLTLRGLVMVGESSSQLAQAVLKDVWRRIRTQIEQGDEAWKPGLTYDTLEQEFYPETHFYAGQDGQAVFYLQPGEFRLDQERVTFSYTPEELEALLNT